MRSYAQIPVFYYYSTQVTFSFTGFLRHFVYDFHRDGFSGVFDLRCLINLVASVVLKFSIPSDFIEMHFYPAKIVPFRSRIEITPAIGIQVIAKAVLLIQQIVNAHKKIQRVFFPQDLFTPCGDGDQIIPVTVNRIGIVQRYPVGKVMGKMK